MKAIAHLLTGTLITVSLGVVSISQTEAATITGTLTADNHYGLFTGNEDGSVLNFIGRNELGSLGSTGGLNWSYAETWTFDANPNDYLYVVTWDNGGPESWIGEFNIDLDEDGNNDDQILSVVEEWDYVISTSSNPRLSGGAVPDNNELFSEISNAQWTDTLSLGDNGISPWGFISGISADADFLNTTTPRDRNYTIFRTKAVVGGTPVPEPGITLGLAALGILGSTKMLKGRKEQ